MPGRNTPAGKIVDGVIHCEPGGPGRDIDDHGSLRHGRDRNDGFRVGSYIQTPPLFFTRDGHAAPLIDMYRGANAFLIAGGPSFATEDHAALRQPGILTMGLNNSVKTFRPNLWCCVDDPTHYIRSIWADPTLMKFVPFCHAEKPIFDSVKWQTLGIRVGDCPNVWYYRRNEHFIPEQYLFEDTINWGNHSQYGGGRSVMLAAVRILFLLGIRKLFLLGVDFKMAPNAKYHFEQGRSSSSIQGNNTTYKLLEERFQLLRPIFERHGFEVYNCNPESNLKAFEYLPFTEAVRMARSTLPPDLAGERTEGLYERRAACGRRHLTARSLLRDNVGSEERLDARVNNNPDSGTAPDLKIAINAVHQARQELHEAKARETELRLCALNDPRKKDANAYSRLLTELKQEIEQRRKVFRTLVRKREMLRGGSPQ